MKSLVLKEMKRILLNLSDVDKIVCQELKMEAFDNIKSISMLSQEVLSLEEKLKCEESDLEEGEVVTQLNHLKERASIVEKTFSVENLSLSVSSSQNHLTCMGNFIKNAVYLKTPELDPQQYSLDCSPMFSPVASSGSSIEFMVHCSLPTRQFSQQVLANLVLSIYTCEGSNDHNLKVLEKGTMDDLMRKKKAFMATSSTLVVNVKKPKSLVDTVEVKMLDTDVLNSPKVFNFLYSSDDPSTVRGDLTKLDMTATGLLCRSDELEGKSKTLVGYTDAVVETPATSASPSFSNESPPQQTCPTMPKQHSEPLLYFHESDYLTYFSPLHSTNPDFLINVDN